MLATRPLAVDEETEESPEVVRTRPSGGRIRATLGRLAIPSTSSWVWRVTAALAALALCGLLFVVAPGSIEVVSVQPLGSATKMPPWARPCVIDTPPPHGATTLAFCAKVDGRVVGSLSKASSGDGERHVVVTGGFHLTLVELEANEPSPPLGARITAVGPLQRASYGLRELIALSVRRS